MRRIPIMMISLAALGSTATACGSEAPATSPNVAVTSSSAVQVDNTVAATPSASVAVPTGTPTTAENLAAPNRDDVNVDARDFERGDGQFFFTSPSGNAFCAFHSFNAPGTEVGCQVRYSVPGNTGRECLNTASNTYGVQILDGGTVQQICTNQGIFVTEAPRVLEYGQIIGVQGDICSSTEAGITCYSGSGSGFMISRDVNVAF